MSQEYINVGPEPNDGLGSPLRSAFIMCNDNFTELYARAQSEPPPNSIGSPGDEAGFYAYDSQYFYYCYNNYDGVNPIWNQISQSGNISVTSLVNGTSNVSIPRANGSVNFGVGGFANVLKVNTANIQVAGSAIATYFVGDGSQLTNLPATNYSNSNVASYLQAFNGVINASIITTSGYLNSFGSVIGNNIVSNANVTGVNINSNGIANLSNLTVSNQSILGNVGNVSILGGTSGQFLQTNGSGQLTWSDASNSTPSGPNSSIQFNNNGGLGGDGNLTWDGTSLFVQSISGLSTQDFTLSSGNISNLSGDVYGPALNIIGTTALGNAVGTTITINSGDGDLSPIPNSRTVGGDLYLQSGNGGGGSDGTYGGSVYIYAGQGNSTSSATPGFTAGGDIQIVAGDTTDYATLHSNAGGSGGTIYLTAGASGIGNTANRSDATSGGIDIQSGPAFGNAAVGGVFIVGGAAELAPGGNVYIDGGVGRIAGNGVVNIGTTRSTSSVVIGNAAGSLSINSGNIAISSNVTLSQLTVNALNANVVTTNTISSGSANISGNITTTNITASGDITANDFDASGTITSGQSIIALGDIGGNNINATGNITADGLSVTGSIASESLVVHQALLANSITSNSSITSISITASGNVVAGNLVANGNISGSSVTVTGNISGANIGATGNVNVGSMVHATGNISGNTIISNASLFLNPNSLSSSMTLPSGFNGMSVGRIAIQSGSNVSVPPGARWAVI